MTIILTGDRDHIGLAVVLPVDLRRLDPKAWGVVNFRGGDTCISTLRVSIEMRAQAHGGQRLKVRVSSPCRYMAPGLSASLKR